jgi:hypothetical protein
VQVGLVVLLVKVAWVVTEDLGIMMELVALVVLVGLVELLMVETVVMVEMVLRLMDLD